MALIPLTQGKSAIVDDADMEMLSAHKWHAQLSHGNFYAITTINGKRIKMHRLLTEFKWPIVDHINRDGLDNRRANLREVTAGQNIYNSRKHKRGKSPYKGIYFEKNRYRAQIGDNKKGMRRRGPMRKTAEEAARDYDAMARQTYGEFAYQNFPEEQRAGLTRSGDGA